jgi:hypothetical protein
MKVRVNRLLSAGKYNVSFEVSDFNTDELKKMASFGVPAIRLRWISPENSTTSGLIAITQINKQLNAVFSTEMEAKDYEESVLTQIRNAIQFLRESNDGFSSSQEVEL